MTNWKALTSGLYDAGAEKVQRLFTSARSPQSPIMTQLRNARQRMTGNPHNDLYIDSATGLAKSQPIGPQNAGILRRLEQSLRTNLKRLAKRNTKETRSIRPVTSTPLAAPRKKALATTAGEDLSQNQDTFVPKIDLTQITSEADLAKIVDEWAEHILASPQSLQRWDHSIRGVLPKNESDDLMIEQVRMMAWEKVRQSLEAQSSLKTTLVNMNEGGIIKVPAGSTQVHRIASPGFSGCTGTGIVIEAADQTRTVVFTHYPPGAIQTDNIAELKRLLNDVPEGKATPIIFTGSGDDGITPRDLDQVKALQAELKGLIKDKEPEVVLYPQIKEAVLPWDPAHSIEFFVPPANQGPIRYKTWFQKEDVICQ